MIKVLDLLKQKKPKVGNILFIAVDGHGGSGKSTFAQWLATKLGAEVVHTDDFASWDNPLNWWPLVIENVFQPILDGNQILNFPRSKWWEGHEREPITQPVTRTMILEGVSSLRTEFRAYISLGFFVDTPKEVCLQRGITRDLQFGKSEEDVRKMWEAFYAQEEEYIERDHPQAFADVIVDGNKPFEDQFKI